MVTAFLPGYRGQPRYNVVEPNMFVSMDAASILMQPRSIENVLYDKARESLGSEMATY